jgi:hypothetical protein
LDLDWTAPWEQLVAKALSDGRKAAAAAAATCPPGTVVTAEWIDRSDL